MNKNFPLTVVSAYYRFRSKHSSKLYDEWMENMLTNIDLPMVIYSDKVLAAKIRILRKDFKDKTIVIERPFEELMVQSYNWEAQRLIDPEIRIHNTSLYIVWNEKFNLMKESIKMNHFNSEWYMWSDIGCFRNRGGMTLDLTIDELKNWPDLKKLDLLPKEKISFSKVGKFTRWYRRYDKKTKILKRDIKYNYRLLAGGMFVGKKEIILEGEKEFYKLLDNYFHINRFAGKDENLYANMAISHKELIHLIEPLDAGDKYFTLQRLLK